MRSKDIVVGEYYRIKSSPNYGYIKPLKIFKPKEYDETINKILVKCEHVVNISDKVGFIRFFSPLNIIKEEK